jgi:hypothetical protein
MFTRKIIVIFHSLYICVCIYIYCFECFLFFALLSELTVLARGLPPPAPPLFADKNLRFDVPLDFDSEDDDRGGGGGGAVDTVCGCDAPNVRRPTPVASPALTTAIGDTRFDSACTTLESH